MFVGLAAGVPTRLVAHLRKQRIRATYVVVASIIVFRVAILKLDDVVGVHGDAAESVSPGDPAPDGEKVTQVKDAQERNHDDEPFSHRAIRRAPNNRKSKPMRGSANPRIGLIGHTFLLCINPRK